MLQTIKHISEHGLEKTIEEFKLISRRHLRHPNLVLLRYNTLESPMGHPIVQECRAIILDESDGWKPVSFPYTKFFNHGEGHAPEIDWKTARVYEKLDGSLITLYFYKGEWHVSTTGTPDAQSHVNSFNSTFSELFWKVWKSLDYKLPQDTSYCYMFELMTPLNRVVVQHACNRIVLHGVRDMTTLVEHPPHDFATRMGWECVKSFPLNSIEAILASAESINPMDAEGFVVVDGNFRRLKIKSPQYVAIHHLKDTMSPRRMLEIVRTNEGSEFLTYFPEMKPLYDEIRKRYDGVFAEIMELFNTHNHLEGKKDFAMQVKDSRYAFACFAMRRGEGLRQVLADYNIRNLETLLKIDELDMAAFFSEPQ